MAGWLLEGTQAYAGTPQRILWAPVVYPRIRDLRTYPVGQGRRSCRWPSLVDESADGPKVKWPYLSAVDQEANENMLRDHELGVPEDVTVMIREARYKFHHGEIDSYGGHSTLTRLKVAAGLMRLDGRTDKVSAEDWDLAGVVMRVSDATRAGVRLALRSRSVAVSHERGRQEADREEAKEGHKYDKAIARVSERIERSCAATIARLGRS